jgi:hypothetical protein
MPAWKTQKLLSDWTDLLGNLNMVQATTSKTAVRQQRHITGPSPLWDLHTVGGLCPPSKTMMCVSWRWWNTMHGSLLCLGLERAILRVRAETVKQGSTWCQRGCINHPGATVWRGCPPQLGIIALEQDFEVSITEIRGTEPLIHYLPMLRNCALTTNEETYGKIQLHFY